jgi:Zinc finger C-x8-C-x5-C-x3-H type (and similar)
MAMTSTISMEYPYELQGFPFSNMFFLNSEFNINDLEAKVNFKTEICRNWSLGVCQWGEKCIFAHGHDELREKKVPKVNYKTKKCKQFHQIGFCIYGNRCQFKHKDYIENNESSRRRLPVFIGIEKKGELIN